MFAHGNKGQRKPDPGGCLAKAWLVNYGISSGDFMPDKDEIHLSEYSWTDVYKRMVFNLRGSSTPVCERRQFDRVRKHEECSFVKCKASKRYGYIVSCCF